MTNRSPARHSADNPDAPGPAIPLAATTRAKRRLRRDEDGLTTLEWLLIVAAVAGLAALAVVLVQNVVDDTAEQLGGSSARATAANVAADTVIREARTASPDDARYNTWQRWELYFTARCERLEILYSDTSLDVEAVFVRPTGATGATPPSVAELNKADTDVPGTGKPQASCRRKP
ncbi:hypothetical protein [Candidatus Poriferisodalis sp.]|uniref:hypothetical protein n=1 Tax=Candidatus Poriferisodalis sp. TaxID=3101277 RepID=UPI003D0EDF35